MLRSWKYFLYEMLLDLAAVTGFSLTYANEILVTESYFPVCVCVCVRALAHVCGTGLQGARAVVRR